MKGYGEEDVLLKPGDSAGVLRYASAHPCPKFGQTSTQCQGPFMPSLEIIDRLDGLAENYSAILCDVWGVIHNGVEAFGPAVEALQRVKRQGKAVVLITNAPRPHGPVEEQLRSLGVADDAYDCVITSGDVTRDLIAAGPRKIFHIGPDRDMSLYDGLDVEVVEEFEASGIVCTGLYDDRTE